MSDKPKEAAKHMNKYGPEAAEHFMDGWEQAMLSEDVWKIRRELAIQKSSNLDRYLVGYTCGILLALLAWVVSSF